MNFELLNTSIRGDLGRKSHGLRAPLLRSSPCSALLPLFQNKCGLDTRQTIPEHLPVINLVIT
jgi:hypothetical protein